MQRQARVRQPFSKFRDRLRALVIEVGLRCEEFDDLEPVRGDVHKVVAAELVFVEEMCGDAELIHGQLTSLSRSHSFNSSLAGSTHNSQIPTSKQRAAWNDWDLEVGRWKLSELFDVFCEHLAEARKTRVTLNVVTHVSQRARDVLDVHRVAAGRCLEAECAERLEIALERHQIEAPPEHPRFHGGATVLGADAS